MEKGIVETHTLGWGRPLVLFAIGTGVVLLFVFVLVWLKVRDVNEASGIMLTILLLIGVLLLVVGAMAFGAWLLQKNSRDMAFGFGTAMAQAVAAATQRTQIGEQQNSRAQVSGARPQVLLDKPKRTLPALLNNGKREPFNMEQDMSAELVIDEDDMSGVDWSTELITRLDDRDISLPLRTLWRFNKMPKPNRELFGGNSREYGEICDWFIAQGVLTRQTNGGVAWSRKYSQDGRKRWLKAAATHSPTATPEEI